MTVITYDKSRFMFDLVGHAGYAEAGKDIVCSAVSTLLFTYLNACETVMEHGIVELENGDAHVEFQVEKKNKDYASAVFDAILIGFRMIAEEYPNFVRVGV